MKKDVQDWTPFLIWFCFQCLWHRKRAVIICRCGALGDVVCTLPMCSEVRQRHLGRLIVFVTDAKYRDIILLSKASDLVYGNKAWIYPFRIPSNFNIFGLVEKIYNPQTTDERSKTSGAKCHLVDDLADSCGITVTARQPRLYPSTRLIKETRIAYGLGEDVIGSRLIIGVNGGRSWPIREWDALKWQKLINKIHSEYNAAIIQFGVTNSSGLDEYDNLTGLQSLVNRLKLDEMIALVSICDLIISIDSGPIHLAGAVSTPVVGLFGPVDPRFRLPTDSPAIGLVSNVPCLFCHNKTPVGHWITGCPNNIICMKQLDDSVVFEAVKDMLANHKAVDFAKGMATSA